MTYIKGALLCNGLNFVDCGECKLKVGGLRPTKDAIPVWGKVE